MSQMKEAGPWHQRAGQELGLPSPEHVRGPQVQEAQASALPLVPSGDEFPQKSLTDLLVEALGTTGHKRALQPCTMVSTGFPYWGLCGSYVVPIS